MVLDMKSLLAKTSATELLSVLPMFFKLSLNFLVEIAMYKI